VLIRAAFQTRESDGDNQRGLATSPLPLAKHSVLLPRPKISFSAHEPMRTGSPYPEGDRIFRVFDDRQGIQRWYVGPSHVLSRWPHRDELYS
jgi:hypothetical protein